MSVLHQMTTSARRHWPSVAMVALTPLLLVGGYLFVTGEISIKPGPHSPTPSPVSTSVIVPALPEYNLVDLEVQLVLVRRDVEKLRTRENTPVVHLGTALVRLGDLERAVGTPEAGEAAFHEVVSFHSDANHWQVRQALSRLDDMRVHSEKSRANQEQWRTAFRTQRKAETMHAKGQFREGIAAAEEALALRRALWGNTHSEVAESLLRLAWLCTEHSDFYLRAQDLADEATDLAYQVWGVTHPSYGDCLYVLAMLADDRGDFEGADRLFRETLETYRKSVGEFSRQFARALSRQGRMHDTWWADFSSANSYRALQIRQEILDPEDPECAESLEYLAASLFQVSEFDRAESLLNQAINIRRAHRRPNEPDHPDIGRSMSLLAACLAMKGDSTQAPVYGYDALKITEKARGEMHPLTVEVRHCAGEVKYWGIADYFGSIRESQKNEDAMRKLGLSNHPNYCRAIFWQARNLDNSGEKVRDDDAKTTDPYLQLRFAALDRAQEAVNAYNALPGGERIGESLLAKLLLHNAHFMTDYQRIDQSDAAKLLDEVGRIINAHGGEQHPFFSNLLQEKSNFLRSQGQNIEAVKLKKEVVKRHWEKWGTNFVWDYISGLNSLSGGLFHEGSEMGLARETINKALDLNWNLFERDGLGQSSSARLATLRECFYFLSVATDYADNQHDLVSIYDRMLAIKGSVSSFQVADRLPYDYPEFAELQQLRREANTARQNLKVAALSADSGDIDRVMNISDARESAESRLAIQARKIVPAEATVSWTALQKVLPPRTAFIDFSRSLGMTVAPNRRGHLLNFPQMLAFITSNSGPPKCVKLGKLRPISRAVSAWRKSIERFQKDGIDDIEKPTQKLAELIWTPLLEHLPEDVDRLIIAPDGPLCFVSFAAMPGRSPGVFALEDYHIDYTNSGRWLYQQLKSESKTNMSDGLLLCGDIQYQETPKQGSSASAELLPDIADINCLHASGPEIDDVRDLFQSHIGVRETSVTLSKINATEARFREALEQKRNWRCIHFAGHGLFIPPSRAGFITGQAQIVAGNTVIGQSSLFVERNQLLLSGLLLAANSPGEKKPGFLTAEDLGSIDLRGTDLVVLSACETGLGCTPGGDGVLGLTRAFLTAGSRSVVSSLWKVDDAATSLLMREFYQNLWERKQTKSDALRNAQRTLLRNRKRIEDELEKLVAKTRGTFPEKTDDEIKLELVRNDRGLVPDWIDVIDDPDEDSQGEDNYSSPSNSHYTHPALWAAFILNGDTR